MLVSPWHNTLEKEATYFKHIAMALQGPSQGSSFLVLKVSNRLQARGPSVALYGIFRLFLHYLQGIRSACSQRLDGAKLRSCRACVLSLQMDT